MMKRFLLLSIKPEFANKIISNKKIIELRKSSPKSQIGDYVLIYSTQPQKSIIGLAKIKDIISCNPAEMWVTHSRILGISKQRFFDYYGESEKAIGIVLSDVCKLTVCISLAEIKESFPKFTPPQTFRYIPFFTALKFYEKHLKYYC